MTWKAARYVLRLIMIKKCDENWKFDYEKKGIDIRHSFSNSTGIITALYITFCDIGWPSFPIYLKGFAINTTTKTQNILTRPWDSYKNIILDITTSTNIFKKNKMISMHRNVMFSKIWNLIYEWICRLNIYV